MLVLPSCLQVFFPVLHQLCWLLVVVFMVHIMAFSVHLRAALSVFRNCWISSSNPQARRSSHFSWPRMGDPAVTGPIFVGESTAIGHWADKTKGQKPADFGVLTILTHGQITSCDKPIIQKCINELSCSGLLSIGIWCGKASLCLGDVKDFKSVWSNVRSHWFKPRKHKYRF